MANVVSYRSCMFIPLAKILWLQISLLVTQDPSVQVLVLNMVTDVYFSGSNHLQVFGAWELQLKTQMEMRRVRKGQPGQPFHQTHDFLTVRGQSYPPTISNHAVPDANNFL